MQSIDTTAIVAIKKGNYRNIHSVAYRDRDRYIEYGRGRLYAVIVPSYTAAAIDDVGYVTTDSAATASRVSQRTGYSVVMDRYGHLYNAYREMGVDCLDYVGDVDCEILTGGE